MLIKNIYHLNYNDDVLNKINKKPTNYLKNFLSLSLIVFVSTLVFGK